MSGVKPRSRVAGVKDFLLGATAVLGLVGVLGAYYLFEGDVWFYFFLYGLNCLLLGLLVRR